TFEICAIDNDGVVGKIDSVRFNTMHVPPPITSVTGGPVSSPADPVFIADHITPTFPGIHISFQAKDPNSRTIQYSWSVDSVKWTPYSSNTDAYVSISDFKNPTTGVYDTNRTTHTFTVVSRNEFGSIDTLPYYTQKHCDTCSQIDTIRDAKKFVFSSIEPPFLKPGYQDRILVLNNSYEWGPKYPTDNARPSFATLHNYYGSLLDSIGWHGRYDFYDIFGHTFPSRLLLANYSIIIFVADLYCDKQGAGYPYYYDLTDHSPDSINHSTQFNATREGVLQDWCYIADGTHGGKLIISAWNLMNVLNAGATPLLPSIIHCEVQTTGANFRQECIAPPDTNIFSSPNTLHNFSGAYSTLENNPYPSVTVDSSKLDSVWRGGLNNIYLVRPTSFGEYLYGYNPYPACTWPQTNIGVRYQGITFSCIYYGFPLFYIKQHDAIQVLRRTFQDVGEN
ncbi:MAG TPA: hypothetical protein VKS81_11225, partial [Bacteroidota bacterium]|nr:hypothetical protein [Bacteroidota bacterium]